MAGTLSLLDAALERWEGWEQGDPFDPGTLDQILAAARNWHTVTTPTEDLILRIAAVLARRGSHHPADYTATAKDVVDALTVTAEPPRGIARSNVAALNDDGKRNHLGVVGVTQQLLCPDVQSPELSVPCPTLPQVNTHPGAGTGTLPFTGSAWIDLLLGIAIGMILVGVVWLYYYRKSSNADER